MDMNPEQPEQGAPTSEGAVPLVPGQQDDELLAKLNEDFKRIKNQKARPTGGVEGTVLTSLCFLNNEQYVNYSKKQLGLEAQDPNKLYLTFNLIYPKFNKLMGRLSAFNAPFKARPNKKDPQAIEEAEIVDRMIIALDEKLDEASRLRERLYWMGVGGVAVEFVPWVPNSTMEPAPVFQGGELMFTDLAAPEGSPPIPQSQVDQFVQQGRPIENFEMLEEIQTVGEVGSYVYGPFNFFMDQNVRSIADLPQAPGAIWRSSKPLSGLRKTMMR
jgi:hypothetical protein